MRKLSIFIAASVDGYIAAPNEDLGFLKQVEKEGEDYGYTKFMADVDTIIVGRKTYDWVANNIGASHYDNGDRNVYVITSQQKPATGKIQFYNGNLAELVRQLKEENGKNIYCDGGAETIDELLKNKLIEEFIISLVPVFLGDGIRLFKDGRAGQSLQLLEAKTFDTGLVQLHYKGK